MPESRKTEIPASPRRILPPALRATPLPEGGTLAREMAPENRNPGHPATRTPAPQISPLTCGRGPDEARFLL